MLWNSGSVSIFGSNIAPSTLVSSWHGGAAMHVVEPGRPQSLGRSQSLGKVSVRAIPSLHSHKLARRTILPPGLRNG